ncbi:hypothetical protein TSAR_001871 [Trichomalopsis sarcophagae]|uniref:Uncharacterized protein n=1 Tax=Trichomalopsis sarcophagae TaxID=543379 RepID=A0A232EUZ9_9HYME|nr:hypothetical protein TSAR_001871 [Trichomalopsis sarcophagae]
MFANIRKQSSFNNISFSAIDTNNNRFSRIDTTDELISSNLTIFGYKIYKEMIWYKEVRENLNPANSISDCFELLFKGERIACVCSDKYESHFGRKFSGFIFAEDSPFAYTFHSIFLKLSAGDFIKLIQD